MPGTLNVVLPARVTVRDVGPRDGLQAEQPVAPAERARIVRALVDAGVKRVEAVSFVSPRAVPSMARPDLVLEDLGRLPGVTLSALVPNVRGAQLALDTAVDELNFTLAASEEYNRRNVKMAIDESVASLEAICSLASLPGVPVELVVSCAFGSPYEGQIAPRNVAELVRRALDAGTSTVTLADTTGMATPRGLSQTVAAVRRELDGTGLDVGLHMHESRGTGLLNCYAALTEGVTRFDTSIGGLGGSPFAAGAAGNVSTEDFVNLLDDLGVDSGIDLGRLVDASRLVEEVVGHRLASRVAYAGPRLVRGAGGQ
jgi:hydroxymethylglutaryl-CoA lyase